MKKNAKFILTIALTALVIVSIAGYAYTRGKEYLTGPQITIESPKNGETLLNPLVTVKGRATNISFLSIDDEQTFADDSGAFSRTLLLASGYTILQVKATDRFGRTVKKTLELMYKPTASSTTPSVIPAKAGIQ